MSRDRYKSTTVKFRTDDPLQMKAWDILHERLKEGKSLSRAISEAVVTLEEAGGTGRLSAGVLTETDLSSILENQTEHICASQREMLDNYFDTLYKRLGDLLESAPGNVTSAADETANISEEMLAFAFGDDDDE